ncbi:MAG: transcription antitermination factor NusB [Alphaproteobacteria bacterium]|nr:transcription antitermination factor NusB [Alphaproteobacteria bacterium]
MSKTNRSTSRLCAVQALYAYSFKEASLKNIATAFNNKEAGNEVIIEEEGKEVTVPVISADFSLFNGIIEAFGKSEDEINSIIDACYSKDWSKDRTEQLLKAILQAGVAELLAFPETPVAIVIKEYVDITSCFYDGIEIKMVNALLDQVSKKISKALKKNS